ncbi:MAG: hypothetical protein OXH57_02520 [Ekhidna sp.]|nr:hypothetical protein [Ekhidna sp.]
MNLRRVAVCSTKDVAMLVVAGAVIGGATGTFVIPEPGTIAGA